MNYRLTRKYIKTFLALSFLLIIAGYSYWRARDLISGPIIIVSEPQNGQAIVGQDLIVKGQAKNISRLSLNGAQIFTDDDGNFSKGMMLLKGYNVITLKAKDKFGKTAEKQIQVVSKM